MLNSIVLKLVSYIAGCTDVSGICTNIPSGQTVNRVLLSFYTNPSYLFARSELSDLGSYRSVLENPLSIVGVTRGVVGP